MSLRRRGSAVAALAAVASTLLMATPAQAADNGTKVQFVVDASSGMGAGDAQSRPRYETTRDALTQAMKALGPRVQAGLRVYGSKVNVQDPKNPPPEACNDTEEVAGFSGGGHGSVTDALKKYSTKGYAPLVAAIKAADEDLGTSGARRIVVVSSGSIACSPKPCEEVTNLRLGGMSAQVDVVALGLKPVDNKADEEAHKQLACIAAVTGGNYVDANASGSMQNSTQRLMERITRGRDFFGAPVTGVNSADAASTQSALGAGTYLDTVLSKQTKYYKLAAPTNSSVFFSASLRPVISSSYGGSDVEVVLSANGRKCAGGQAISTGVASGGGPYVTASAGYDPQDTGRTESGTRECIAAHELIAAVTWKGDDKVPPVPVQLVVSASPWLGEPIGDVPGLSGKGFSKLPPPTDPSTSGKEMTVPEAGTPGASVVGGSGFTTAGELKAGTSTDTITLGDLSYYKVKLDWGQSALLRVDTEEEATFTVSSVAYGPRRGPLSSPWDYKGLDDSADIGGQKASNYAATYIAPIRANNVFPSYSRLHNAAEPGWYYFAVATVPTYDGQAYANPTKLRLTLKLDGQAGDGKPDSYVASDVPGQVDPDAAAGKGTVIDRLTSAPVLGFGMLGVACLAAGIVWLTRRPR